MNVERVAPQDATYLYLEGPTTPYHIAGLAIIEGPAPDDADILDTIDRRLWLFPRFRQRLAFERGGRPVWRHDRDFDLAWHVRRTALEPPGDEQALKRLAARLLSQHLNRHRPLWEWWVIDGLAGGRWAVLMKVHHAMFDGVSGANVLASILGDDIPLGAPDPNAGWPPLFPRVPGARLGSALTRVPMGVARAALRAAGDPRSFVATAERSAGGLVALAGAMVRPAPRAPFNAVIGPNRILDYVRVPLQDLKDIKNAHHTTIKDVVLAVVAGGLRRWMIHHGHRIDGVTLRALVPVSLRRPGDEITAHNLVSGILAPLPVGEPDTVSRLAIVHEATAAAKRSPQASGAAVLISLTAVVPPALAPFAARAQNVQRLFNVSLPNVAGSPEPLFLCGRRVVEIVPAPPMSANCGFIACAESYAGDMTFGLVADPRLVADLHLVAEGIEKDIVELVHRSGGPS